MFQSGQKLFVFDTIFNHEGAKTRRSTLNNRVIVGIKGKEEIYTITGFVRVSVIP
jgi:hypothetical protein